MATKRSKSSKKSTSRKSERIQIEAQVVDVGREEEAPPLAAYAFNSGGKLLGRVNVDTDKATGLDLPASKEPGEVRVLVGPRLDLEDSELLSALIRLEATERMIRPGLVDRIVVPIDRIQWHCWLRFCTVRGTLVKRVNVGDTLSEFPVCDAEVEVYEVDPVPLILPRIPDYILERLREIIRHPIPDPNPDPILPRPPMTGPAGRFESMFKSAEILEDAVVLGGASNSDDETLKQFRFTGNEQRIVSKEEATAALRGAMEQPELVRAASIDNSAFRQAMLAHPIIVRPLLCFIWPAAVTTQLVATTTTDKCGHFRAIFYRGCSSDIPDLYFKAYRRIAFWRIPIYAPTPIACHTRWNYICGTEVKLVTNSPFAKVCPRCPPVIAPSHWVLAMAVGNTSLARLHGAGSALSTTPQNLGLLDTGAPWGGYLRFRFEFDHDLRTDLNVRYYRASWRKVGSGNPYVPMTDSQLRHFMREDGPDDFSIEPYSLGPRTVGGTSNLFEIPPAAPPGWPNSQWVTANAVVDSSSASFDSAEFAPAAEAGMYQIRLELFDGNGSKVNANTLGISYRIPATTDLTETIPTDDAASMGLVTPDGSLRFMLRVDNNECTGSIEAAELGSQSAASDECGVLEYASMSDTVDMPFTASHPNGFASYTFKVVKGLSVVPGSLTSGPVGPPPGEREVSLTTGALLGACTTAGFAADLRVTAMATDGWNRQQQYDAHPLPRPFVLTPE
jgi:hypothetical protein